MAFETRNASPPRKNARSESVPPKGKKHSTERQETFHRKARSVPPKGKKHSAENKSARSESAPPGQGKIHCEVRLQTRPQCTISSTILSLILSIVQSLVYYKKHTSNLLTLKSESGILWSS